MDATDLVLGFVNSRDGTAVEPSDVDHFVDGVHFRDWLASRSSRPADASDADAATARELREALIEVLRPHSGEVAAERLAEAEEQLRRIALRHPLTPVVTAAGVTLTPAQPGLFGEVLAGVAELSLSGQWARLKVCRAFPSRRVFVDHTRNRSAVYCSSHCASKTAMRAYRERKKAASSTTS
jgi:predicted RNA-binding Zn ribbon-like protein